MQREFNISLSQEFYSDVVYLSQYDSDYNIVFHVKNKYAAASVDGLTAKFTGLRPDGLGFEFTSTGIGSDVTFTIDNTVSAVAGTGTGEIVFTDANDMVFGSANVQIIVEPAAHPEGTIDADEEELRDLAQQCQEIVDTAAETVTQSIATAYSASSTYAVGDYCIYNNTLYRCKTAIATAEAWTAAHWTAVTVGGEISALKEDLSEYENIFTADVSESVDNWLDAHPEATTTVQDGSLTYKKLVAGTLGFVTPEMFGAVGDGVTDDTQALQNAINAGFAASIAVYLTKNYLITSPIKVKGISDTYLNKGSLLLGNGYSHIIAGAAITSIIETDPASDTRTYGITIKDLILDGNNNATNGIYSEHSTSECIFENITINECINGVHIIGNCYLNNFKAVRLYHCTMYGILFENGNNTSNVFEKCYVDTCANAYKINGQYSSMISCCADNITGIVFELFSFAGSLVSCGSESIAFTSMFKISTNSNVFIAGGLYFGNPSLSGYYFDVGIGCRVGIYNATINWSDQASSGSLCKLAYQSRLTIKDTLLYKAFNGVNSLDTVSHLFNNTAVGVIASESVTLDADNQAELSLSPLRYTILSVYSTNRSGWIITPFRASQSVYKIKVTSASNYAPTISDKNFTLAITYIDNELI